MNTPASWSDIDFEVEITADGSPSLRQIHSQVPGEENSGLKGESMHHSGGAAEETELIYGKPIAKCFDVISCPHFISVGLGLGYIELVIAREALLKKRDFTLESWEIIPELREHFLSWLHDRLLSEEVRRVYDLVASYILGEQGVALSQLKCVLRGKVTTGEWQLRGGLLSVPASSAKADGILFDAFSAKTTPYLWDEGFLQQYFAMVSGDHCFVSTYASRTSLKKALKACDFEIQIREGFKSKRNSTLAFKGIFKETFAPAGIS